MDTKYKVILEYIESYWQTALVPAQAHHFAGRTHNRYMQIGRLALPGPFVSPNHTYFAGAQFYWDSYFTILGLVVSKRVDLAKSMVENLCFLQKKFGLIPARNSLTSIGRTQPPYLTRMAFEIYDYGGADKDWMDEVLSHARQEYKNTWTNGQRLDTKSQLSRYKPKFLSKRLAVYESGWDKSARFSTDLHVLPVDLNCLLFQYEADFLTWAKICNDKTAQTLWQAALNERQERIAHYFWNERDGFFYDYDLSSGKLFTLKTLAGFYPMWCGAATAKQAEKCRAALQFFEQTGGLTSTEKIIYTDRQWDYPNGWAPLQWIVIQGLRRYGYHEDADRLTRKWLDCNAKVFNDSGLLWEKYDVVNCKIGLPGRYPTPSGFAWTNSVFVRLFESLKL